MNKNPYPSEREVLAELYEHRRMQLHALDKVSGKLMFLCAVNGCLFLFTIVVHVQGWVSIAPCVGFLLALLGSLVYRIAMNPSPKILLEDYLKRAPSSPLPTIGCLAQICADITEAYRKNKAPLKFLAWCVRLTGIFTAVGVLMLLWWRQ